MKLKNRLKFVILFLFCLLFSVTLFSQKYTEVKGRIKDAQTNEPLGYANVFLKKAKKGGVTDITGNFRLTVDLSATDTLEISYLGYQPVKIPVKPGEKKERDVQMLALGFDMPMVTITSKKERYTKKGNPAVELMEAAIQKKDQNRLSRNEYYQYKQHEISQIAVNNFSDTAGIFNKFLKLFGFTARYVDLSDLNGKPILPIFISENIGNVYYNREKNKKNVDLLAHKGVQIHRMLDMNGLESVVNQAFRDVDIYEPTIPIFGIPFVSPFSSLATTHYKFFINDTVFHRGDSCIQLTFFPHNPIDFGFSGKLFLVKDTASLAVKRVELRLPPHSGMNWVDEMFIKQEFEWKDSNWCLVEDEAIADLSAISEDFVSLHARRSIVYQDYVFNKQPTFDTAAVKKEKNDFWLFSSKENEMAMDSLRLRPLRKLESNTYIMYDELHKSWKYKVMMNGFVALITGYVPVGMVDIGRWNSLVSYNEIEGVRARIGARTNTLFHPQIFLNSYIAYGFGDEKLKYQLGATYSFKKRRFFAREYPLNNLSVTYQEDNKIPGNTNLLFDNSYDKFWFSFRSTPVTKMTRDRHFGIDYEKEFVKGFLLKASFHNVMEQALGEMNFNTPTEERSSFTNSQFGFFLQYSPNDQFYQMGDERRQILNTKPIFSVNYALGIKDFLNADYTFHRLELSASKLTNFPVFGSLKVSANAGKIWNPVPYPLLFIPEGNQSFFSLTNSFNLMNFMEFIADEYVNLHIFYRGSGYVFNRIPLINRLKIRGVIIGKMVWGHLNSSNLPENNPNLMVFPTDKDGNQSIFLFDKMPYAEVSVGIYNILDIIQVDFIKRLTYLDNPNALSWGIRMSVLFGF